MANVTRPRGLLKNTPSNGLLGDLLLGHTAPPQPNIASSILAGPTKHKVFVSYHHHGDRSLYDLFRTKFYNDYDVIYDNSVEREIDSDNSKYVIQRIRDNYIHGSSCTVVLVGAHTWERKYVDWEISATLDRKHGLIALRLPTAPVDYQGNVAWPARLRDNIWSKYAPVIEWGELHRHPERLRDWIQDANGREKRLIYNLRTRRERNEGGP